MLRSLVGSEMCIRDREFRYVNSSQFGTNGTDPRNIDSDGDGLTDGEEYWGWFLDSTSFSCHYLNDDYVCAF